MNNFREEISKNLSGKLSENEISLVINGMSNMLENPHETLKLIELSRAIFISHDVHDEPDNEDCSYCLGQCDDCYSCDTISDFHGMLTSLVTNLFSDEELLNIREKKLKKEKRKHEKMREYRLKTMNIDSNSCRDSKYYLGEEDSDEELYLSSFKDVLHS